MSERRKQRAVTVSVHRATGSQRPHAVGPAAEAASPHHPPSTHLELLGDAVFAFVSG